jgi:hypothetical protein
VDFIAINVLSSIRLQQGFCQLVADLADIAIRLWKKGHFFPDFFKKNARLG